MDIVALATMVGLRPIAELMTINFAFVAMDHIVNQARKMRYMFGGQFTVLLLCLSFQREPTRSTTRGFAWSLGWGLRWGLSWGLHLGCGLAYSLGGGYICSRLSGCGFFFWQLS